MLASKTVCLHRSNLDLETRGRGDTLHLLLGKTRANPSIRFRFGNVTTLNLKPEVTFRAL